MSGENRTLEHCDTYWGSHGCDLFKGHDGPCVCECAVTDRGQYDPNTGEYFDDPGCFNVGHPPYYGTETNFYGDDIPEATRAAALSNPTNGENA